MIALKTERLILRMFREEDFNDYAEIFGDPEIARYLGDGQPLSRFAAWRSLAATLGHWQLRGYGMWAIEERQSGALVGRVGFFYPEGWPGFELGWVLNRPYWGRGYATEGAKAALNYGFGELGREHTISLIRPENFKSIQVAERLGEKREGKTIIFGQEALIYGISQEDWAATLLSPLTALDRDCAENSEG
ncbi:MAG: GNAT family N-acetyltransferase [Cyanobacteriota bacterium]|nr:GNAT family N-acetyltransferase [Cyanobacteriota bacterium]